MATSTRLRGNQGFILELDGTTMGDDAKAFELTNEPKDDSDLTFYEAQQGTGVDWTLALTGIVSFDEGSLYSYLWDNAGQEIPATLGPWGNVTPTTDKPHFSMTVKVDARPPLANEARSSLEGAEFEVELSVPVAPVKITDTEPG